MNFEDESRTSVSGSVKVHESVLSSIVRKAVASVPDVIRLSGSSFIDNIAEIVNARKAFERAMQIEVKGDTVSVEVRIVVKYGVSIPSVASMVRGVVTSDLVRMTGKKVARVDVFVMDVDDEPVSPEEEEPAE
jgi:uncharacterized alkaline shock family protein YloU